MRTVRTKKLLAILAPIWFVFFTAGLSTSQAASNSRSIESPSGSLRALPDFTPLADEIGPAVVNISTTQIVKGTGPQTPFSEDQRFGEFWRRVFGGALPQQIG